MKRLGLIGFFRILIGLIIIGLGVYLKNWIGFLGILPIFTAFSGRCDACGGNKKICD